MLDIQLIVVNYHTDDLLQRFIDSYVEFYPSCRSDLLIVNVDADGHHKFESHGFSVVNDLDNCGYARACNWGAYLNQDRARNLAFFNADTRFVDNNCVDYCVDFLDSNDNVAAVGPLQYSSQGKVTHGGIFGDNTSVVFRGWQKPPSDQYRNNQPAVTVSGSAYFTKSVVWKEMHDCHIFREQFPSALGAFPPFKMYYEETSYSYHVRDHGYDVWYVGEAEMIHEHAKSPESDLSRSMNESRMGFRKFMDAHGIAHD